MGLVIGTDEAGYGPNLGPLVVTATVWEVPGDPRRTDLWKAFSPAVSRCPERGDRRLHIADSKQVYSPARGIAALERGVLSALRLCGAIPASFRELWMRLTDEQPLSSTAGDAAESALSALCPDGRGALAPRARAGLAERVLHNVAADAEPWFAGCDLDLPCEGRIEQCDEPARRWADCCGKRGIRLRAIRSDVVLTARFNALTRELGSKGSALSRITVGLLRGVWDPDGEPALIVADKHGGRNRYRSFLEEVLDGRMIFCRGEREEASTYCVGESELCFRARAEAHLAVALASMVSKYVRELAMELFNRYWRRHLPELRPTKGYAPDAARFKRDIAEAQARLGIGDEALWRER